MKGIVPPMLIIGIIIIGAIIIAGGTDLSSLTADIGGTEQNTELPCATIAECTTFFKQGGYNEADIAEFGITCADNRCYAPAKTSKAGGLFG